MCEAAADSRLVPAGVKRHCRRCFVLGAGFSKGCGLPLAGELTALIYRALRQRDPTDISADAPLAQHTDFGYEAFQDSYEAARLLFPGFECSFASDRTWPDFEELISALDEARQYQSSFERVTATAARNWAENTKRSLLYVLENRLGQLTEIAPAEGLDVIREFVRRIDQSRDSVVSFNWDVLLEIAAADLGVTVSYNGAQGNLAVAKPHGSFNLVDSPKDKYDETRGTTLNVPSLDIEMEYRAAEARVVLRAQDAQQARLLLGWAEAPLIVEPNIRKLYDNPWIEFQWARALQMVRSADELFVIGFSLPPADIRPRLLMQLSRLPRPGRPPKLILIDPNATNLAIHYRRLTGLEAEPFTGTLRDWLANS